MDAARSLSLMLLLSGINVRRLSRVEERDETCSPFAIPTHSATMSLPSAGSNDNSGDPAAMSWGVGTVT